MDPKLELTLLILRHSSFESDIVVLNFQIFFKKIISDEYFEYFK